MFILSFNKFKKNTKNGTQSFDQRSKTTKTNYLSLFLTKFDSKKTYQMRSAHHPGMEDALHMWYCNKRNLHIPVSDDLLIEKGRYFGIRIFWIK